jgi:hypothetical protein
LLFLPPRTFAAVGVSKTIYQTQSCRLAAARFAEQHQRLAAATVKLNLSMMGAPHSRRT